MISILARQPLADLAPGTYPFPSSRNCLAMRDDYLFEGFRVEGEYRVRALFDDEAEARAWVNASDDGPTLGVTP